jgi:hypothetical protein
MHAVVFFKICMPLACVLSHQHDTLATPPASVHMYAGDWGNLFVAYI